MLILRYTCEDISCRDNTVGIESRLRAERLREFVVLFSTTSRPSLGLTQLPVRCVPGALLLGKKRPSRESE